MNFSLSTFTIELDAKPALVFQAKWQAEADQVCHEWIRSHWDELSTSGPGGIDLPPAFKLRLARPTERVAYEAESGEVLLFGEVRIVKLADHADQPDTERQTQQSPEEAPVEQAEGRSDARGEGGFTE